MLQFFQSIPIPFPLPLTHLDIVLLICLGAMFVFQLYYYLRYLNVTAWYKLAEKHRAKRQAKGNSSTPPVSVLISAHNEAENLQQFLPKILEQDYPEFEVVVVNDRSEDTTQIVLEQLRNRYSNLRLTFIPMSANFLSTKKLAITLAVRAARYEHLILTDADCYPASKNWLKEIAQTFQNGEGSRTAKKQIVLGYGAYEMSPSGGKRTSLLNRLICYDTLFNGLQYLGFAFTSRPYMGVGRNMAYTKSLFMKSHGFEGLLAHRAGDDDLLIQKIGSYRNTTVCLSPDSLTFSPAKNTWKDWLEQKSRHLSVAPAYGFFTKIRLTLEPLTRGGFYAMLIAIAIYGSHWAKIIALAAFVLRYIWQLIILNLAAKRLQQGYFYFLIIFFDIFLPLNHLTLLLSNLFTPSKKKW